MKARPFRENVLLRRANLRLVTGSGNQAAGNSGGEAAILAADILIQRLL
jgi:hypothetical protein